MLRRLDAELVRRGLAKSRAAALELISTNQVWVDGVIAIKAQRQVADSVSIVVKSSGENWVSRGAHKLIGALQVFGESGLQIENRIALDAGASTGGFTQVLLRGKVAAVIAVDVGYGQLAWELRSDPRVTVMERCNVRNLSPAQLAVVPDLVVADLSFISLCTVLPALVEVTTLAADYVLMVKPQFEVGKSEIGKGVVTDPQLRTSSVLKVVNKAAELGLVLRGVSASQLPGPEGNVEYFVWLHRGGVQPAAAVVQTMVANAVAGGPV